MDNHTCVVLIYTIRSSSSANIHCVHVFCGSIFSLVQFLLSFIFEYGNV